MLLSLRTGSVPEEFPLKTGSRLEVADGVNLDSDSDLETVLIPQISRDRDVSTRSREPSISSAKLKYQSEIRNIIRSYQDLKSSNEHLSDESDSGTDTDQPDLYRHRGSYGDTVDRSDKVYKVDKEAVVVKGKSKVVRALEEATRHLRELGERVREARVMKIDVWSVSTRWR